MKLRDKQTGEVFEAVQWMGRNVVEMCSFMKCDISAMVPGVMRAETPHGLVTAKIADIVIKQNDGSFLACGTADVLKVYDVVM